VHRDDGRTTGNGAHAPVDDVEPEPPVEVDLGALRPLVPVVPATMTLGRHHDQAARSNPTPNVIIPTVKVMAPR
jgi:hypothetical protein